jgi:hypothetical protein
MSKEAITNKLKDEVVFRFHSKGTETDATHQKVILNALTMCYEQAVHDVLSNQDKLRKQPIHSLGK